MIAGFHLPAFAGMTNVKVAMNSIERSKIKSARHTMLTEYYESRATEYEGVYQKPERTADLAELHAWLKVECENQDILEIACGTGYWTATAAQSARSILATDFNEAPLTIARQKNLGPTVRFMQADAYALPVLEMRFTCIMAHFWWSHIPHSRQSNWLSSISKHLLPGGKLLLIDNRYVEGSSTPVSRTDAEGNTYQQRRLENGSTHEILKNFPDATNLKKVMDQHFRQTEITQLQYFWTAMAK
jgi:ubiquinone/menaquinone biosynthesis C-methylase UbiE